MLDPWNGRVKIDAAKKIENQKIEEKEILQKI